MAPSTATARGRPKRKADAVVLVRRTWSGVAGEKAFIFRDPRPVRGKDSINIGPGAGRIVTNPGSGARRVRAVTGCTPPALCSPVHPFQPRHRQGETFPCWPAAGGLFRGWRERRGRYFLSRPFIGRVGAR